MFKAVDTRAVRSKQVGLSHRGCCWTVIASIRLEFLNQNNDPSTDAQQTPYCPG